MHGPVAVAWILTAVFVALALPCLRRLTRLDYVRLGQGARNGDLAELLLVVAMVAMFSPIGGPIPAAGWQAVLVLASAFFGVGWWRSRGTVHAARLGHAVCAHHTLSAAAMLYMVTAMPHSGSPHGPWLTVSTMDTSATLPLPLIAVAGAAYFVFDAARTGVVALRAVVPVKSGDGSRALCRVVMGAGMGYMLLAAAF